MLFWEGSAGVGKGATGKYLTVSPTSKERLPARLWLRVNTSEVRLFGREVGVFERWTGWDAETEETEERGRERDRLTATAGVEVLDLLAIHARDVREVVG